MPRDLPHLIPAEPGDRRPFPVGTVVRLAVAAGLLAVVFDGVAVREVAAAVRAADRGLVLAAFAVNWSGILLSVLRWRALLRAQGGDATHGRLVRSFLVAQFFNNLLPSTIGGDAVRAYDTRRAGTSRGAALTTVAVDRLLGLGALALFAIVSATLLTRPAISTPVLALGLLAAAGAAGVTAWVILAPPQAVVALIGRLPVALRRRVQILARQLGDALVRFHAAPGVLAAGFAISVVLQVSVVIFYSLLGAGLGFEVPFWHWFLIVPVAVLAMLAPVSINAIGVREGIFAFLLASYGVGKAGAVAFAWLAYASVAMQAVLGGALYAAGRRSGGSAAGWTIESVRAVARRRGRVRRRREAGGAVSKVA